MAWEWSHTQKAEDNVRDNIMKKDTYSLDCIMAEWIAFEKFGESPSTQDFQEAEQEAGEIDERELAEKVWVKAKAQETCDNGGFNAWICPYGCHMVSFD